MAVYLKFFYFIKILSARANVLKMNPHFLYQFFVPFKNLQYFLDYDAIITKIVQFKSTCERKWVQLVNSILMLKTIHFLVLGNLHLGSLQRALQFDGAILLMPKPMINNFAALATLSVIYHNYILFERPNIHLHQFLYSIIFSKQQPSFFKHFTASINKKKENTIAHLIVRRNFLYLANLFQSLILITSNTLPFLNI